MPTNKAIGNAWEAEIDIYLGGKKKERKPGLVLGQGFEVERAFAKTIWIKRRPISVAHDFYGAVDFIALHPQKDYVLFIQATTSPPHLAEKKKQAAAVRWSTRIHMVEVWLKHKIDNRKAVRAFRLQLIGRGNYLWVEHEFKLSEDLPSHLY